MFDYTPSPLCGAYTRAYSAVADVCMTAPCHRSHRICEVVGHRVSGSGSPKLKALNPKPRRL